MPINDQDDINYGDLAQIGAISIVAMIRGGNYTYRQKRRLTRLAEQAKKREDKKRAEAERRNNR